MNKWFWLGLGLASAVSFGVVRGSATAADTKRPDDGKLCIISFGAHPDDCEIRSGGAGAMWSALGHHVKFVSLTNGDVGHWLMAGGPLAKRRTAEALKADKMLGITGQVLDIHDGELMPTLENRKTMIRLIRGWNADIVIGHRPNDYHPDHRYTGVLMQDAAYMVAVPFLCPDSPPLKKNPVFLYSYDRFERPNPFRPDILVPIDSVIDKKVEALVVMESQFIEGGALGARRGMPKDKAEREARRQSAKKAFKARFARIADRYREELVEQYGDEVGKQIHYAEAYQICEYGRRPNREDMKRLFPFLPEKK